MRKIVSSFCGRLESTTSRGLFCRLLVLLLFGGPFLGTSWAQNRAEPRLPYPEGSDITYQWSYSCPPRMVCGFSCPGTGAAAHATKLTIYLGRMPVDTDQAVFILFYSYATREVPRGNGFSMNSGLGTLACQVSGMTLDYSGPPKSDSEY
jgi:hypothetical protein